MAKPKAALREKVQAVLVSAEQMHWGTLLGYRGTQADLIAAGVAQPYFFEDIGKSGQRTRSDEFGDEYHIRRKGGGIWELHLSHRFEPSYLDVTNERARKCKWYPEAKASVDTAVSAILARYMTA